MVYVCFCFILILVSIISVIILLWLFVTEFGIYIATERHTEISLDANSDEKLRIDFDITFDKLPCACSVVLLC